MPPAARWPIAPPPQALTNLRLYIERDRLPPAEPDEFYLADLVGLRALSLSRRAAGHRERRA